MIIFQTMQQQDEWTISPEAVSIFQPPNSEPNNADELEFMVMSRTQKLDEWTIGSQVVSLYQQSDRFVVSKDSEEKSFRPSLYDMGFASNVIHMFHKTIEKNLRSEEKPHSSCFLPKFCVRDTENPDIHIALFGRIVVPQSNNAEELRGTLQGIRWGVFNAETEEESTFEAANNQVVEGFIRGAPASNKSHIITRKNEKGKSVEVPALDHYAMSSYMKRFRVDLIKDTASRIQGVALHHISLFDSNVILDEQNWAVTLVSTKYASRSFWSRFTKKVGHSMIAYEGIKDGKSFLCYAHLTKHPGDRNPELRSNQAQLETLTLEDLERSKPLNTINGPTWVRSKPLVENMVNFASEMRGKPIKYSLRAAFKKDYEYWMYFYGLDGQLENPLLDTFSNTCLDMCYRLLAKAGIWFNNVGQIRRPIKKVREIRLASITILPEDFNGTTLSQQFQNGLLSNCVILSPKACSVEDCKIWYSRILAIKIRNR